MRRKSHFYLENIPIQHGSLLPSFWRTFLAEILFFWEFFELGVPFFSLSQPFPTSPSLSLSSSSTFSGSFSPSSLSPSGLIFVTLETHLYSSSSHLFKQIFHLLIFSSATSHPSSSSSFPSFFFFFLPTFSREFFAPSWVWISLLKKKGTECEKRIFQVVLFFSLPSSHTWTRRQSLLLPQSRNGERRRKQKKNRFLLCVLSEK